MLIDVAIGKARTGVRSARTLLTQGDLVGAVDRAYYAMFHAARALLYSVDEAGTKGLKTHRSVIARFGEALVARGLDRSLGRMISQAEHVRINAEYADDNLITPDAAAGIVADAETLVSTIGAILPGPAP